MKVVGLVSGGKDSTYNLMECVKRGHEIVCLLNLYPPSFKKDGSNSYLEELDSYMYQSVGSEALEEYAACMKLPLIRRPITGTPLNTTYTYDENFGRQGDEVEDLFEALKEVLEIYPDVKGVSSGAIRSSYQKNRVEDICQRLGLISLAYLWERDQPELLRLMIRDELEAVLIKVATAGLSKNDLGHTLDEMHEKLLVLKDKFGINVCGEGGEFETFTLDCPLFKTEKLQITGFEVVIHKEDLYAPVAYLRNIKINRIPK